MIGRHLLPPFREAGPGSAVVLVSSIEGLFGSSVLTAYCASKGGVLGVMRSLAQRYALLTEQMTWNEQSAGVKKKFQRFWRASSRKPPSA